MPTEAAKLVALCKAKNLCVATAESCTGGFVAAAITDIPGASDIFQRGFVTYSNDAKIELLGVSRQLLKDHGAVSEPVALAMAAGTRAPGKAQLGLGVTGIAGPGGGSAAKPVGLVFIAVSTERGSTCQRHVFPGSRAQIRAAATAQALRLLINACQAA